MSAPSTIEYGLIAALIGVVVITGVTAIAPHEKPPSTNLKFIDVPVKVAPGAAPAMSQEGRVTSADPDGPWIIHAHNKNIEIMGGQLNDAHGRFKTQAACKAGIPAFSKEAVNMDGGDPLEIQCILDPG